MTDPDDFPEADYQSWSDGAQKRPMSPNIPIFNGSNKSSKPPKNPKIEVLVDEIIDDGSTEKLPSYGIPHRTVPPGIIEVFQPSEEVLPKPSPYMVAAVFQEKEQPEEMDQGSSLRTEDGFSNETPDSDESIDITDIKS